MFCQKCGAEITPRAVFCIKCGNRVPAIADFGYEAGNKAVSVTVNAADKGSAPVRTDYEQGSAVDSLTSAVVRFQSGDSAAFDTIYNESKKYIYYTILKTTGNKDVADDILQETYIDVYRSLDKLQSPAAFKGWAARIAQHKISRYYQKKSPELFSTEEEMDDTVGELTEDDMSALPEDAMVNKEVQRLISEIIDELPENQKSTIVSFYYNQMSIPEIAESMGVPENTVKTYLFRGKKKIKDGVLDIEKKHGTKLYALPLAGLLGLLFAEEAKAAVVTTTASQVLGTVAAAGGTVTSATGGVTAAAATGTVGTAAAESTVTSVAGSMTTAAATGMTGTTITTGGIASAVTETASSAVSATVTTSAGRAAGRAAGTSVFLNITKVFISTIFGFSIGICTMSYVMNNTEIRETIHEIPVIGKILDIGVKEEERTFLGEWRSVEDGNRMTVNEDNTFEVVYADGNELVTGTWSGDDTELVFREDLGPLNIIEDALDIYLTGVYDSDTDTITVTGFDEEVYVRIDGEEEESYEKSENSLNVKEPFIGKWKFGDNDLYIVELFNDYNVLQEYSATYSDSGKPKGERKGKWSLDGEYIAIDFMEDGEVFRAYLKYDHDNDTMFMVDSSDKSLHEMIRLY